MPSETHVAQFLDEVAARWRLLARLRLAARAALGVGLLWLAGITLWWLVGPVVARAEALVIPSSRSRPPASWRRSRWFLPKPPPGPTLRASSRSACRTGRSSRHDGRRPRAQRTRKRRPPVARALFEDTARALGSVSTCDIVSPELVRRAWWQAAARCRCCCRHRRRADRAGLAHRTGRVVVCVSWRTGVPRRAGQRARAARDAADDSRRGLGIGRQPCARSRKRASATPRGASTCRPKATTASRSLQERPGLVHLPRAARRPALGRLPGHAARAAAGGAHRPVVRLPVVHAPAGAQRDRRRRHLRAGRDARPPRRAPAANDRADRVGRPRAAHGQDAAAVAGGGRHLHGRSRRLGRRRVSRQADRYRRPPEPRRPRVLRADARRPPARGPHRPARRRPPGDAARGSGSRGARRRRPRRRGAGAGVRRQGRRRARRAARRRRRHPLGDRALTRSRSRSCRSARATS